jgi:hypothetical protein
MRYAHTEQIREYEHNLADLYIIHNDERLFRQNHISNPYESSTRNVNPEYWTDGRGSPLYSKSKHDAYSITKDFYCVDALYATLLPLERRAIEYRNAYHARKNKAKQRLRERLTPKDTYRPHAMKGSAIYAERQNLNATIKATLKHLAHPRTFDPSSQLPHLYNNLMEWSKVLREFSGSSTFWTSVSGNLVRLTRGTPAAELVGKFLERLQQYAYAAYSRAITPSGNYWEKVVWHSEEWFTQSKHYQAHALHVSTSTPSLLAYHQNGDKMMRNIQTQIKPGRYLQEFFSDVLSEKDIRYWAERQVAYATHNELRFIGNDDPDGWVWVYEHPSGFSSCMQYNHTSRYLDGRLGPDTPYHPVRCYAHPENNLALAYLGDDRKQHPNGRVYARAIVNTAAKTYARLYGDNRIQHQLEKAGYAYDSDALRGQWLQCIELPWGGWAMPYLDGSATEVDLRPNGGEPYFKVVYDGEYGAQNSEGMIESESSTVTCPCCGEHFDDDEDFTYVEDRGESICQSCRDSDYQYAVGFRGREDYFHIDDCVYCESDGRWYLEEYASRNDVYECPIRERWYGLENMVNATCGDYEDQYIHESRAYELPDGEWCAMADYESDFDALLAEHGGDTEDDESDDDSETDELPCAPVISADQRELQQTA